MSELLGTKNMEEKKEKIKEIILRLHKGESPEKVKEEFKNIVMDLKPAEIAILEGELIKEGLPAEEVHRLCDAHLLVFKESLERNRPEVSEWHPLFILMEEHRMMVSRAEKIFDLVKELKRKGSYEDAEEEIIKLDEMVKEMIATENHYLREENVLFPYLEKYGISEPPKIMWMDHDQIRKAKKQFLTALNQRDRNFNEFTKDMDAYSTGLLELLSGHFYKENNILFPTSLRVVKEEEWYEIRDQFDEIGGYCCYSPPPLKKIEKVKEEKKEIYGEEIKLPSGSLTVEELESIFNTLPVDITFIDKNDRVKYFSETPERIFVRTRAIIGRTVQKCHPQKSVHIVEKILDDFKSGRKDHADFWIQAKGKFIYIRYFAVRNKRGEYLGTLEVSQDITDIKKLKGERRIYHEGD